MATTGRTNDTNFEPITLKDFGGIINKGRLFSRPPNSLSSAVNVDFSDTGEILRRKGYTIVFDFPKAHSLWSKRGRAFFATDRSIYTFTDYSDLTEIVSNLIPGQTISYEYVNGVYYILGGGVRKIYKNGVRDWGVERPTSSVSVSKVAGALLPGRYGYTFRYVDDEGTVSGISPVEFIEITSNGEGLQFSNFGLPTNPNITYVDVYLTQANGEQLYHVERTELNRMVIVSNDGVNNTVALENEFITQVPFNEGSLLTYFNGRMYSTFDEYLFYSLPYSYNLFDTRLNIGFESKITMLLPTNGGMYIGTQESVHFLGGRDVEESNMITVCNYGAIRGTGNRYRQNQNYWLGEDGIYLADDNGSVKNISEERINASFTGSGASYIDDEKYVATHQGKGPKDSFGFTDSAEFTIIRNGVKIS